MPPKQQGHRSWRIRAHSLRVSLGVAVGSSEFGLAEAGVGGVVGCLMTGVGMVAGVGSERVRGGCSMSLDDG